jgi:toxin ParE1/3/4
MSKTIHRRRAARQDLVEIFRYYAREAGFRVAERFFAQAEATFKRVASVPGMGTHYDHDHPALAELRFFPVTRFPNDIVFYRSVTDGIQIVRVLHGACDIDRILAEDLGINVDVEEPDDSQ